jgi:hypothetical protein
MVGLDHERSVGFPLPEELIDRIALAPGIPAKPKLAARRADRRPQELEASRAQRLRLFDIGDAKAFQ